MERLVSILYRTEFSWTAQRTHTLISIYWPLILTYALPYLLTVIEVSDVPITLIQNDYKVVCFCNQLRIDGVKMYRNSNGDEKYQPCRALLKHHFRMAVLLNMKARAGYPEWEEDIPEGYDQMAEIYVSQQGRLRLETVLAEKLNVFAA